MSSVFTDEFFLAAMGHSKSGKMTIFGPKRKITIDKPSGDVTALLQRALRQKIQREEGNNVQA
jgi:hypothetical protein